ncbi:response regulator [Phenylobacterium ferrooxidans]|uniref:Response regulator n=1 Tax=Phenylobacterium ferrooxidans TaxID=2982689 RepID=A0ABW6CU08_9CAUL|nr:helix-turn-helix domain-containing protein [Phenylobacterium sp.]
MAFAFLIVDDDPDVLKAATMALAGPGAEVIVAGSPDGIEALAAGRDAVLLDMNFALGARSGEEGMDGLARLKVADPELAVVLMTTFGGVGLAVAALKCGAEDFILKPWRNDALEAAMAKAGQATRARRAEAGFTLDEIERRAIIRALSASGGNMTRAASLLGLTRPALYRRLERHGL